MQSDNRFFDDLARVAGGALSALAGMKNEIEAMVRQQFERLLGDMNLVTRDEFEAVQAMAAKARTEQEAMAARLAALEARLGGTAPSARSRAATAAKPAARKASPAKRKRAAAVLEPGEPGGA